MRHEPGLGSLALRIRVKDLQLSWLRHLLNPENQLQVPRQADAFLGMTRTEDIGIADES